VEDRSGSPGEARAQGAVGSWPVPAHITNTQDISEVMDQHKTGDTVMVTFFRGRRKMSVSLTLGEAREVNA
jgi:hypothetical protein